MNLIYIDSRFNFMVLVPQSHMILTCGTKNDERSFKDFMYKLIHRVPNLNELDSKKYVGDGIIVRNMNLNVHINLNSWNTDNFKELSQQLFEYITTNLRLKNYQFIDANCL